MTARSRAQAARHSLLPGIGGTTAAIIARKIFSRQFSSCSHLGSYLGLMPSADDSGPTTKCQGISKAGNSWASRILIEVGLLVLCSCLAAFLAALRQKIQLSQCADSPSHLFCAPVDTFGRCYSKKSVQPLGMNRREILSFAGLASVFLGRSTAVAAMVQTEGRSVPKFSSGTGNNNCKLINHESPSSAWVSPKQYFDGDWGAATADHSDAMQRALDSGRSVVLPEGDIRITRELKIIKVSGITIKGAGRGLTRIVQCTDNCGVFYIWGTRLKFEDFEVTWRKIQSSDDYRSSAFRVAKKNINGAILATSIFSNIQIRNCGIGFDLRESIGYSNSFQDIGISSFSISALVCDSGTAHTQSRFDAWTINNQTIESYLGVAVGGSNNKIILPGNASNVSGFYVGMAIVIRSGVNAGPSVRWITEYDGDEKAATFYPPVSLPMSRGAAFDISCLSAGTQAPMNFHGFSDLKIGMLAFEFIHLPQNVSSPIVFDSCRAVSVDLLRFERISYRSTSAALLTAAGLAAVIVNAVQAQYIAVLKDLGCKLCCFGRTYNQATITFNVIEADGWNVTAGPIWAISSGKDRAGPPYGGVIFNQIPSGDGSFSPSGQHYDVLGGQRQTAILGRPRAELRGASYDEGNPSRYKHSLMLNPDFIRFNSPLRHDVNFELDDKCQVAGARVAILRTKDSNGSGIINVIFREKCLFKIKSPGENLTFICDGVNYYLQ